MKNTGRIEIDIKKDALVERFYQLECQISSKADKLYLTKELIQYKNDLEEFRAFLAANRGTESFENDFKWGEVFDAINQRILYYLEHT